LYGIIIWTHHLFVLSQITRLTDGQTEGWTDGRTDRILIARPCLHSMQHIRNGPVAWPGLSCSAFGLLMSFYQV